MPVAESQTSNSELYDQTNQSLSSPEPRLTGSGSFSSSATKHVLTAVFICKHIKLLKKVKKKGGHQSGGRLQ